ETVGLRKVPNPRGKRSKDQDECEQRHAEPQKPVADEARKAFALERSRSEITGQQEEEAHEIGLVGGAEEHEQNARRRAGRLNLAPEPAADRAVRNRRMVKDYQCDHHRAETVDIKFAPRHESLYAGAGMRGSGSKPQKAARSLSLRAVFYWLRLILDDDRKRIRLQACAAYQGPVDLFLSNQRGRVVGLHAAAVENAHGRGYIGSQQLGHFGADDLVRVDGNLRRRR